MKNKRIQAIAGAFVLTLIAAGILAVYIVRNMPNKNMVEPYDIPQTRLVIGDKWLKDTAPPFLEGNQIFLPFDTIKKYIDNYIWYDDVLDKVTITTKDRVIRMKTGSLEALINERPMELKFSVQRKNDILYVPIDFLDDLYGISLNYIAENDVVTIDYNNMVYRTAWPNDARTYIRTGESIKEPIVKKYKGQGKDELELPRSSQTSLIVFEESEEWYRVRTYDGVLGYVKKDEVTISGSQYTIETEEEKKPPVLTNGKINLVWDMTYSKKNIQLSAEKTPGIDVISPTWFEIIDREGTIKNRATPEYMEYAHKNGWQVWALFSNAFSDIEGTSIILNNSDLRQEIIRNVLAYASIYKLDGINIDFENIYKSDKDAYTQFVREFYPLAKEQGLYVSVDVSVPDGSDTWSKCFDRKALAESVDYVCLMTYDQHWASSPNAGSTAELSWVEENLQKTLTEVPAEKLLLGVPLYTRLWSQSKEDGKLSSVVLGVQSAWSNVEDNEAVVAWNDVSGQYQTSYEKEGTTYQMWIEDKNAVNMKTSLIHKYDLAGACVWAANFADENVFMIFERNLKQVDSYEEWQTYYSEPIMDK